MPSETLFRIQLILGYVAWLLCFRAYLWPRLKAMDLVDAHRAIATLHSFRLFGLAMILPGFVGPNLPGSFAQFAAYGDLATAVLAILALLTVRMRPLFWFFVIAFNLAGVADLLTAYYHAILAGLPAMAGAVGWRLRSPGYLRADIDDHAPCRILFAAAPSGRKAVDRIADIGPMWRGEVGGVCGFHFSSETHWIYVPRC